jgi:hypothetical protein
MKIKMRTTAASPERILEAGKVYNLPAAVAQPFLDGKFAEPYSGNKPVQKLPLTPDPEEDPLNEDEDDEELDEE